MGRRKLRPRQRFIIYAFWGCFIVFCLMILGRLLFGAVEGTITTGKVQVGQVAPVPTAIAGESQYGTYIVPSNFRNIPTEKPVFPTLEQINYIRMRGGANEISIRVAKLVDGTLVGDGTYILRVTYPDRYKRTTITVNGVQAPMFTDEANMSATIYLQKGDLVACVSLTGGMVADPAEVTKLASNWHWK